MSNATRAGWQIVVDGVRSPACSSGQRIVAHRKLARLTAMRMAGQFGDGMYQAALAGAILFDPTKRTEPLDIAAGFVVLLVPYSVIGPYAGAILDRWDRRRTLVLANLVRVLLIGITCASLTAGVGIHPLLILALATVGVGRFVMAGISASLPHVVRGSWLVPTNSALATGSAAAAALGAAAAAALTTIAGHGSITHVPLAVAFSAIGSVAASVLTLRFHRGDLGPELRRTDSIHSEPGIEGLDRFAGLRTIAGGLRTGAIAVWQAPGVTTAMVGIAAHRIVFGIDTLIMVLAMRTTRAHGTALTGGMVGFGVAVGATAAGMLLAAALTPMVTAWLSRPRTIVVGLALALVVQGGVITRLTPTTLLVGAFLLGLAGQTIKLTGDATMQFEIDDIRRGHVFALQDTVFNIGFVAALGLAAPMVADDGHSPTLIMAGAGAYAAGLVGIGLNRMRIAVGETR